MDLADQLMVYFGTGDLSTLPSDAIAAGAERMRIDFGLLKDRDRRFALWALMYMLGVIPELDVAFADAHDRDAARSLMDLMARSDDS